MPIRSVTVAVAVRNFPRGVLMIALLACAAGMAIAEGAAKPSIHLPSGLTEETAALAIRGDLAGGEAVLLDMATIRSFPAHSFTCVDGWDGKTHKYTGALLSDVLAGAGIAASSTRITVNARNKYSIPIRRSDYERLGYLLAWEIDGRLFGEDKATKNRGDLSIAIDFASHPELDLQVYKHQLVWQVSGIVAE
jgi:hypothetical protein